MPKIVKKAVKSNKATPDTTFVKNMRLGENQKLEISVFSREDIVYMNFRKFYRTQKDPSWKPARQGMTLPLDLVKKMRALSRALQEMAEEDLEAVPEIQGRE